MHFRLFLLTSWPLRFSSVRWLFHLLICRNENLLANIMIKITLDQPGFLTKSLTILSIPLEKGRRDFTLLNLHDQDQWPTGNGGEVSIRQPAAFLPTVSLTHNMVFPVASGSGVTLQQPPAFHTRAGPLNRGHIWTLEITLSLLCCPQDCPHDSSGKRQCPPRWSGRHRKAVSYKTRSSHLWLQMFADWAEPGV